MYFLKSSLHEVTFMVRVMTKVTDGFEKILRIFFMSHSMYVRAFKKKISLTMLKNI